jgi:hypothetical protein
MKRPPPANRRGITLFELLLALALTALVMVVISMAIDLHLRTFDLRRTDVEHTQVARSVLRYISADLRNAVPYAPVDMSGVEQMAAEMDMGSLGMGAADLGAGDELDLLGDLGLEALEGPNNLTENTIDIAGTELPASIPGLYGNQSELQVDVTRLPRIDQYHASPTSGDPYSVADIPSDVKTVAYFLRTGDEQVGLGTVSSSTADVGAGLVRRELDRAVTCWAAEMGDVGSSTGSGQLLAPEVNYLEFRYFDGAEWLTEWDSEQMGGLPVAVEILVGIDPAGGENIQSMDVDRLQDLAATDMNDYLFRLVVRLPVAEPALSSEAELEDESLESVGL